MLYLIRHGETTLNVQRVLQPVHTLLSARGVQQSEALGLRLADGPDPRPVAVLASDLPRALKTGEVIARACGINLALSPTLRERDFGELRGRPYDSLGFDPLAMAAAPAGGESMAAFLVRCDIAWREVLARQAMLQGPLAVVTHGLVIRAWLAPTRVVFPPGQPSAPAAGLPNASLTVVEPTPPHTVHRLACVAHLQGGTSSGARNLSGG